MLMRKKPVRAWAVTGNPRNGIVVPCMFDAMIRSRSLTDDPSVGPGMACNG